MDRQRLSVEELFLQTVEKDPERARLHTRLLLRVREWEGRGRSPDILVRGTELAEYEHWLSESGQSDEKPEALGVSFEVDLEVNGVGRKMFEVGFEFFNFLLEFVL